MWAKLRTRSLAVFAVLVLAMTLACGAMESTPPPNQDFVGSWVAVDGTAFMQIGENGHINYKRNQDGTNTELNLPAKEWSDSSFTVGALGMSTVFSVESPPEEIDGVWHMTVDGLEYTR